MLQQLGNFVLIYEKPAGISHTLDVVPDSSTHPPHVKQLTKIVSPHHNYQIMTHGIDALLAPLNSTYKQLIYEKEPQPSTKEETRNRQGNILLQGQSFLLIFPPLLSCRRIWKVAETLGEEPIKRGKTETRPTFFLTSLNFISPLFNSSDLL